VAGAALDVHAQEPPRDWRLARHPKVLALPHLGASTKEAQERVGTDIARQVRDYLKGGVIQCAVNFYSLAGDLYDRVRPAMDLAERLGLFLAQACRGSLERIELGVYGDLRELDTKPDPLGGGRRGPEAPHGGGPDPRQRRGRRAGAPHRDPRVDLVGAGELR
jgi:D-3-phosphoglycerate dehydrogenase / 2-oxoglutarate reductase